MGSEEGTAAVTVAARAAERVEVVMVAEGGVAARVVAKAVAKEAARAIVATVVARMAVATAVAKLVDTVKVGH